MNPLDKVFEGVEPVDFSNPPVPPAPEPPVTPPADPQPPAEPPVTPPAETPPAPPAPTIDKYAILSETLGREFKSDDDIVTYKTELTNSVKSYEEKLAALQAERDSLAESFDPMQLFASPELYTLNGLLKKFPGKSPAALTEIATKDFAKMALDSPVEVLALDRMLEHPGIYSDKNSAIEDVLADYNLPDMDEVDDKTLRRMKVAATEKAEKFKGIKEQIDQPKKVDLTAERAAKQQAETERQTKITAATEQLFSKEIPESLKALEFPVTYKDENGNEVTEVAFRYDIGETFIKSKIAQDIIRSVRENEIRTASEFTPKRAEELKRDIADTLKAIYSYQHRAEIYSAMRNDLAAKFADEQWMKRHNVRPLRQDGPTPRVDPEKAKYDRIQRDHIGEMIGKKI